MIFSDLLGVRLHHIPPEQAIQSAANFLESPTAHYIVTVNPEFLMAGQKYPWFRDMLNRADLALIDGIGIQWGFEFFSAIPKWTPYMPKKFYRIWLTRWIWVRTLAGFFLHSVIYQERRKERNAGSDVVVPLLEQLPDATRVYLLGGLQDTPERTKKALEDQFPRLQFVGAEAGLHDIAILDNGVHIPGSADAQLTDRIRATNPQVVLVAFGQIKQEWWISHHLFQYPSVRIFMGVGGAFDFIAGRVRRAPPVIQSMGLEWLWRLVRQPWRIPRIWTAVVRFPRAVLTQAHQEIELLATGT